MAATDSTKETLDRANDLYWGTEQSVNQIAEEMDLSKGALYGMIRPLRAGLGCPECGEELVSPNRTARDRGALACPTCAWEGADEDAIAYGGEGAITFPVMASEDDTADPAGGSDPSRNRLLAGGALIGAAVGLALVLWTRRAN